MVVGRCLESGNRTPLAELDAALELRAADGRGRGMLNTHDFAWSPRRWQQGQTAAQYLRGKRRSSQGYGLTNSACSRCRRGRRRWGAGRRHSPPHTGWSPSGPQRCGDGRPGRGHTFQTPSPAPDGGALGGRRHPRRRRQRAVCGAVAAFWAADRPSKTRHDPNARLEAAAGRTTGEHGAGAAPAEQQAAHGGQQECAGHGWWRCGGTGHPLGGASFKAHAPGGASWLAVYHAC